MLARYDGVFAYRPPLTDVRMDELWPHPQRENALQAVREFLEGPKGWLYLHGTQGDGKTFIACALLNELRLRQHAAVFAVVPDLLDWLRNAFEPSTGRSFDADFASIKNLPVLLLDDLDAQKPTEWGDEKLYELFNHRYRLAMPTIITSNTAPGSYRNARLASRFGDVAFTRSVFCGADDLRRTER